MLSGSQHFEFEAREICLSSFPQNRKEKEPYIHPLSKPSISLHMCTESLFTESGSAIDPFSAPEPTRGPTKQRAERASGGAFPPPLASGMRVHSRREGGRLVISASASRGGGRLKAERGDGRLRLSLLGNDTTN
ncbi:hypothetical protein SASPL_106629 [Salvia splendens]|uniref:FAF domain-containing protein n=1 Tax=Salvia splendens TaxID=180675 RepID=A0A8X9AAF6_SALSN|nr:hypothetical protein SASPL_106629 [Salvia splendens]